MNSLKRLLTIVLAVVLILPLVLLSGCDGSDELNRGWNLYQAGKYEEAIAQFNKALELDPNQTSSIAIRGRCYVKLNQYDRAIADLNTAIARNYDLAYSYYYRGLAYEGKGQRDQAIGDFNQAVKLSNVTSLTQYANEGLQRLGQG
jgi:tetratricopeptide (TPR) repeat protein